MIVYVSDAGFHVQGDGILNGLLNRHDEQCHLDENQVEKDGNIFDYPSMGQAARILNNRNIMVGFTFSDDPSVDLEHAKQSYKDLKSIVANSELEMMDSADDTRETATKIFELYKRLAYRAIVTLDPLPRENQPFKWEIKSTKHFDEHGNEKEVPLDENGSPCSNDCSDVLPEHSVKYTMVISHVDYEHTTFSVPELPQIHVGAVDESLTVNAALIDSCECGNDAATSNKCDDHPLKCGVCDCGDDYTDNECKAGGTTSNCFGIGECVCGNCHVRI